MFQLVGNRYNNGRNSPSKTAHFNKEILESFEGSGTIIQSQLNNGGSKGYIDHNTQTETKIKENKEG